MMGDHAHDDSVAAAAAVPVAKVGVTSEQTQSKLTVKCSPVIKTRLSAKNLKLIFNYRRDAHDALWTCALPAVN